MKLNKSDILNDALNKVNGDRLKEYGEVKANFEFIAKLWSDYKQIDFTPSDVAVLMILLKASRLKESDNHVDSWVDIAGYAACGGEVTNS